MHSSPMQESTVNVEVLKYAAFTDHGRGGNPAGVVLGADALTDVQMLASPRRSASPRRRS